MTGIFKIGLSKHVVTIVDTLEEITHDLDGMSGAMDYNGSSHGATVKELKALAQEIGWLAEDVADICRNGATYKRSYQVMGQYEFFTERLYDIMDRVQGDYWRDEINDNIEKLAGLYAPMLALMSDAVFKDALYSYSKEL